MGYNITVSEMGYIYYIELGNSAGGALANTGLFENLTTVDDYWTDDEIHKNGSGAWVFDFDGGHQFYLGKGAQNHAWAVHDGELTPVPVPACSF